MSRIMVKLKENNIKEHLIAASGTIISKEEFVEVEDNDGFVKTYIINDSVYIEDVKEEPKPKKEPKGELDEKKVKPKGKNKN